MHRSHSSTGLFAASLVLLAAGTQPAAAQFQTRAFTPPPPEQEYVRGEILVKFRDNVATPMRAVLHEMLDARVIYESEFGGFQRVSIPGGVAEELMVEVYAQLPMVEYAELNSICKATATPNDPYYSLQWHYPLINVNTAWDTATGTGAVVAILDSGVAYENFSVPSYESTTVAPGVSSYLQAPDLAGTSFVPGYDYINFDSHPNDNNAHGTHVAGTVAQSTNDSYGVAGVAYNASIMPLKVLDYTGSGTAASLADGLYFAANNGADVANMSLSWSPGYNPGSTVQNAVTAAYNAGVVLVAAAGNSGVSTVSYPAAYSQVIAVGAIRYDLQKTGYSQYGSALEIMAPGGDTGVNQNGDAYVDGVLQQTIAGYVSAGNKANPTSFGWYFYDGTSMAAPHIAGVVALMISNGITGVENIRTILHNTATDRGAAGWDSSYGWGIVNAEAAVNSGGGGGDTTAPTPNPMSFSSNPAASGSTAITMTASLASDTSGVEYFFDCLTTGGHDSGWQSSRTYVDTGLTPNTSYTYRVKARDLSANLNETAYSGQLSASTDPASGGWVVLTYDDFEAGLGNWTDGGSDCSRYTGGTHAWQGSAAMDIQDNSGTASSFYHTSGINVASPGYTQIEVEFFFKAVSMENNEDFFVEYFDGSVWRIVAVFARPASFQNNSFYTATVAIHESSYNFPSNMKIRFRCDASNNSDDVYVDQITVRAQ